MLNLKKKSLTWALKHALRYGDTDVFPQPFEYSAIEFDWDAVSNSLAVEDIHNWITRPQRALLAPKAKYAFRVVTQLDPLDYLLFTATLAEIAEELESKRVPTKDNRVFSYRVDLDDDGQFFDPAIGYREFLATSKQRLEGKNSPETVATADIADFYSRIYHHRLENALIASTKSSPHVTGIKRFLSGWNNSETFGIPIGGSGSRLLAEITLIDVDEALLASGVDFIRYNDDYRIFAKSKAEAYRNIAFLADVLYRNHGLTLQPQKTAVYDAAEFQERFLSTPRDKELSALHRSFEQLAEKLNLNNWYEPIEYDELEEEQQEEVNALNLSGLLEEQIGAGDPDVSITRFVLRRLGQLRDVSALDLVIDNIDVLYPVLPDIVEYIKQLSFMNEKKRHEVGERLLGLLSDSIVSELPYHRMWLLEIFASTNLWDNDRKFLNLNAREPEYVCKRKLILAMGRAQKKYWITTQWRNLFGHPNWSRRALIAAASCMPKDARTHWYRSVARQLDLLETAVLRWAKANPFESP